jgi:hypothetical protein
MISFWHLTAVCCIPSPNTEARLREQEIFRQVGADRKQAAQAAASKINHGRWEKRETPLVPSRLRTAVSS